MHRGRGELADCRAFTCFCPLPRVMTQLLDHPEAMVLPWHEVLEPCLNSLSGPSSDSEVPEPGEGWGRERQPLGHQIPGNTLEGPAQPFWVSLDTGRGG